MLWQTGKGINPNDDEAYANKLGMFIHLCTTSSDSRLYRGDSWYISMVGVPPQHIGKHPKNLAMIVSNSIVGALKLIHEYDQATSGTLESSMVSMPLPSQPCDPNDAEDEGAVEVCLKLFKVHQETMSKAPRGSGSSRGF